MYLHCIFTTYVYIVITVQFLNNASSAIESDGFISFTVISLIPSDQPFSVQVFTREIVPQSAEGLLENVSYTKWSSCFLYICIPTETCTLIFMHVYALLFSVSISHS